MTRLTASLPLLLLAMATPGAQAALPCSVHRTNEVICRSPLPDGRSEPIGTLTLSGITGQVTATISVWTSACGESGTKRSQTTGPLQNGAHQVSAVARPTHFIFARSSCAELFITDCRAFGIPRPCGEVMNVPGSSYVIRP